MKVHNTSLVHWLRWCAVLPGALLAGTLATLPLHWVLYSTLGNFAEPYPELPERLLSPFVVSTVFIWAGSRIAPARRIVTSTVLFGAWMFLIGGFVFLTLSGATWFGARLYFPGGGFGPLLAVAGALIGLYIVRRQTRNTSKEEVSASGSALPPDLDGVVKENERNSEK